MDDVLLNDPTETDAQKIERLENELMQAKKLSERRSEWWEEERRKNKAIVTAFIPIVESVFYNMEHADILEMLPLDDVTEKVAEKMQSTHGFLDRIADDVATNYLDTDQLAEDVLGKLDQSDIVSEVKSEAVQEVANVLADALRSIG